MLTILRFTAQVKRYSLTNSRRIRTELVIEQERRLQAAIAKMNEATSVVYAIYAEVQAARSALSP